MAAHSLPLVGRPDAVLFQTAQGPVDGEMFCRAVHRLADRLPDAPVVNLCQDRLQFAATFAAALVRGQVTLLTSDRSSARLRQIAAEYPGAVTLGDAPGLDTSPGEASNPAVPADRLAAIVFTSGSTGTPVGHGKPWGALVARSLAAGARFALADRTPASIVATVPPPHMYGFETSILLPLHAPASSVCGHAFYPADITRLLQAAPEPRILVTTPLQLRALLQHADHLPALFAIISATAPLEPDLAAAAECKWGTRVLEIYGATELGSIASRRTTCGDAWQLYPGVAMQQRGGAMEISAPGAPPWPLSDAIQELPEQRFRLLGRPGDMIKIAGKRASLAGLNAILCALPGVLDGVFLAPDDAYGAARMQAFVVAPDTPAEIILQDLRRCIDPAFLPRRVVRVAALPRNEVGKLTHAALAGLSVSP